MFQKATKSQSRGRVALVGPSGSGKTFTGLTIAKTLAQGGKVAVVDTERGSASKYADLFDFDVVNLDDFSPQHYIDAIREAGRLGYAVLLVDSLTHAWSGSGGALEMVDKAVARSQSRNSFSAWREVTPIHNMLVDAMLQSPCHVIVTMRVKTEYIIEQDERTKKQVPRKIGLAPIQRDGMEYEFDVVGDMDPDNRLIISKTRCPALAGAVILKPGAEFAQTILDWLTDGAPLDDAPPAPAPAAPTPPKPAAQPKPPSKKADPSAAIGACNLPAELEQLLAKWEKQRPLKDHSDAWLDIISRADAFTAQRVEAGKWPDDQAALVYDRTRAMCDVLKTLSEAKEAM